MTTQRRHWHLRASFLFALLLVVSPLIPTISRAQGPNLRDTEENDPATVLSQIMRLERVEVSGGAELITVFARLSGLDPTEASTEKDSFVPLVSILRDTLGDDTPENNRLRYVWPLTYTRPTTKQRLAAAIPFFYTRVGNKEKLTKTPPPALDLASPESEVWDKIFWTALQGILLDPYGTPIKASTSSYRRNTSDYRRSHIIRALSVLALYQAVKGESAFTPTEMSTIQARLFLSEKTFGGLVDDSNLQSYYVKKTTQTRDERGHNWELLRQKAEAESLYFEPLTMPDGSATHALLWVAKRDLLSKQGARYSGRFLNIANPWTDKRLLNWKGYVETRYFDSENHPVDSQTPGAEAVEMIPLGLYGLDNPKIPMLLVDFRDSYNPKKREMSRRVLNDVTRNVLSLSKFGNLPFFLGRTVFDFVTGRRGMDINQPSRLATYSQLKLLLALNTSMEPELRSQVSDELEKISLNPFENDLSAEAKIATQQYDALLAYAKNPNGLAEKIERDRRAEMLPLEHGDKAQLAFRVLNVLSFGKYVHREELTDDMEDRLDIARRIHYHTNFLQQVAKSTAEVDITWNLEDVKRSLHFIAEHGSEAGSNTAAVTAKIFARTKDIETRRACLDSLSRIHNPKAKNELLRISQNNDVDKMLRDLASEYLRSGPRVQPIAATVSGAPAIVGQP
ncbi:MAG TPA: hypothetical protein VJ784_05130 [Pyrinomonadaceae bacterium]|jgi:hypothetical protein|nr:hypothetical protein [Pyrinomonadaceae bacterium]